MKNFILFYLIFLFSVGGLYAQDEKIVSVDLNSLPPDARKSIQEQLNKEAQEKTIEKDIETYANWAGKGKEIGNAVREGLGAVKDVTLELAESDIGKVTIWLIVWKIAGKDIVGIISGIFLFIISTILVTRSYFKTFTRKIKIESEGIFKPKKWEKVYPSKFWDYPNAAALTHFLFWFIMTIVSINVMF